MANPHHPQDTLKSLFFNVSIKVYPSSERAYHCTSISDLDFARLGILRCISHAKTGQEFLQHHADQGEADIDPGHFFKGRGFSRNIWSFLTYDFHQMRRVLLFTITCLPLLTAVEVDFTTQIQPIFSENCYACLGPEEKAVECGLRLDVRERRR